MDDKNVLSPGLAVGVPVRYFLLGDTQEAQQQLTLAKERCITNTLARLSIFSSELRQQLQELSPILITGSCGYLGEALLSCLRSLHLDARGFDLMAREPDVAGDVSDEDSLCRAAAGCRSIIHTAALHAPNLDFYTEADFRRINLDGTRHVLNAARKMGETAAVVFSSTTSLMNTQQVKEETRSRSMILKASEDYGTPRNIYGVTKKLAEDYCKEATCNVAILRCSRFFAEDAYDTSVEASQRSSKLSNGNVKANELLYGTRCSLDDMIMAHLLSLVKIGCVDASSGRQVLGPLIVSAPSPMLPLLEGQMGEMSDISGSSEESLPEAASRMYAAFGWSFPESFGRKTGRILDSRPTWQCLNWKPTWDFQRLVQDFQDDIHLDIIQEGIY